jgi:ABC-type thiamin/hydroxymethylpyrimidine transport system permease subunit
VSKTVPETETNRENFIFQFDLVDVMRLTMFGTIIAILKNVLRTPMHLPGHTSIYWMGILVLGKGLIPKFGSGALMGLVSGIVAVILGSGKEGVFVFFKYFVPGLLLDFLAIMFFYKLESPWVGAICGALISLSKMVVNLILGLALDLPMVFLTIGLGFSSVSHVIFGAAGGAIAAVLIKRLKPRLLSWD